MWFQICLLLVLWLLKSGHLLVLFYMCVINVIIINSYRLSELNFALQDVKLDNPGPFMQYFVDHDEETERYLLAKSYFDLKEYDRYVQLYTGQQMPSV